MIEHNLLSLQERRLLAQHLWYLLAKRCAILIVGTLVAASGLLFVNRILLSQESSLLDERINASLQETVVKQGGPLQDNIQKINARLSTMETIQSAFIPWASFLADFFAHIPSGIELVSLSTDATARSLILEGTAKTRNDLLQLRSALEEYQALKDIRSTGSDLTQRENIDFAITATLKDEFWLTITESETQ